MCVGGGGRYGVSRWVYGFVCMHVCRTCLVGLAPVFSLCM